MAKFSMLKTPIFAKAPTLSVLQAALASGGVLENRDRIAYVLVEDSSKLYHVALDGTLTPITGDSPEYVSRVTTLPPAAEGDPGKLYIVGNVVYSFDGSAYHPTYETLQNAFDEYKDEVDEELEAFQSELNTLAEQIIAVGEHIDSVEDALDEKADKATTLAGYGITDAYTQAEVDSKLDVGGVTVAKFVQTAIDDAMGLNIVLEGE